MSWEDLLHILVILAAALPIGAIFIVARADGGHPAGDEGRREQREAER